MKPSHKANLIISLIILIPVLFIGTKIHHFFAPYERCIVEFMEIPTPGKLLKRNIPPIQEDYLISTRNSHYNYKHNIHIHLPVTGSIPSLTSVLYNDASIRQNLTKKIHILQKRELTQLFDPKYKTDALLRDLLFEWARVNTIPKGSRGYFFNAQELSFLEKISGYVFYQRGVFSTPAPSAASGLKEASYKAISTFSTQILSQTSAKDIFKRSDNNISINEKIVQILEDYAHTIHNKEDREKYWSNLIEFIDNIQSRHTNPIQNMAVFEKAVFSTTSKSSKDLHPTFIPEAKSFKWTDYTGKRISFYFYGLNPLARMICLRPDSEFETPSLFRLYTFFSNEG